MLIKVNFLKWWMKIKINIKRIEKLKHEKVVLNMFSPY